MNSALFQFEEMENLLRKPRVTDDSNCYCQLAYQI